jgi:hypothetical protein
VQLRDNKLDIVPFRQLVARYAHRGSRTMMANFAQAFIGHLANELDVRLVAGARMVLVHALVGIALERLRMLPGPRRNLVFVDENRAVLYPGAELVQCF